MEHFVCRPCSHNLWDRLVNIGSARSIKLGTSYGCVSDENGNRSHYNQENDAKICKKPLHV
jgi:hypothetical protein